MDSLRSPDPFDAGSDPDDESAWEVSAEDAFAGDSVSEVECTCWESDLRICSGCRHRRGCLEISCGYLEHFDLSSSTHEEETEDEEEEEAIPSDVADESNHGVCRCETSKKYHCPRCSHIESCHLRVACSEYWFHFPGDQELEAQQPTDSRPDKALGSELPARNGAYWTRQEDESLARLFSAGWGFAEISAELQRTERSIIYRLSMLCFDLNGILVQRKSPEAESLKTPWTTAEDELLTTLFVNKTNLAILSQALKRSQPSIGDRLMYLRLVQIGDLEKVVYYSGAGSSKPGIFPQRRTKSD